jgi:hypothetical protein
MAEILRSTLEQGNSGDDFRAELLSVHAAPEDRLSMLPSLDRALIEAGEEMNFDWPEWALSGWRGFLTTSATTTKRIC